MNFKISLLCSAALIQITYPSYAADGSIEITGNQNKEYIATNNVNGSSFSNFTATSKNATFNQDLIGTRTKNVVNQTINFSGSSAKKDIIGLYRDKNSGNISNTNTITISAGKIKGNILATADGENYNGSARRNYNNINIQGGEISGNVEGDARKMSNDEIKTQLNNYTLKTDTPFAKYEMINDGNKGYIVFNKVSATNFVKATDVATANHNNLASGSHRLYELFVNRNMKSTPLGMSSGDDDEKTTHIAFMPVVGHAHQNDSSEHAGHKSDYYGGVGYIEHNFTPSIKTGLGLSYLNNDTDYNNSYKSTSSVDSYRPFAYLNYNSKQWRFDFVAGWGKHKIKNNRKYDFDNNIYSALSDYNSEEFSAHFSGGYRFYFGNNLIIQPMVSLFAANIKTDTYEETGNGPMNMHVQSEDYNSLKTMSGIKIKKEYKMDNGMVFKPEMHLRWYHELTDTQGGVSAYFLAQQELFDAKGIDAPKDIADVAFRLTTENDENFDIFVESFYQFGKDFYNVGGTVGLKYNF